MLRTKPILSLLFRDQRPGIFSIERLFSTLTPAIERDYDVNTVVLPNRPNSFLGLLKNIHFARRCCSGVIHVTGDAHYVAIFLGRRTILTIHDCGDYHSVKGLKGFFYRWLWFKLPCKIASHVTVISEATRIELEKVVGSLGAKITVIENCCTFTKTLSKKEFCGECPRILQIGSGRHKNLDTLISSVLGIDCHLHIIGKPHPDLVALMESNGTKFTIEFAVSDDRLKEVYSECDILYFASRYEGFGLPILEAQAAGLPVITSNRMSMPEVSGGGAILVDPESSEEIRRAICDLCHNESLRNELVSKGLSNVSRYSVEAIASRYVELYNSILSH